jgi:hypothetical protein
MHMIIDSVKVGPRRLLILHHGAETLATKKTIKPLEKPWREASPLRPPRPKELLTYRGN